MQTQPFLMLMPFSSAMEHLLQNAGTTVTRLDAAWRAKFKAIYLVPGSQFAVSRAPLNVIFPEGTVINYRQHFDVVYADGTCGVWTPTQEDMGAQDWHECDVSGNPV